MNRDRSSRMIPDPLPKSVKVRSTCNACQQAKIRCSHERPSCRRCQKHNIDCVYSMSRRLGRPAKKRDNAQDDSLDCGMSDHPRHQTNRRVRSPRKRKAKRDSGQRSVHDIASPQDEEEVILDEITFNDSIVDDMSTEDTRLPTPPFLDTDKLSLYEGSDTIDLSDNWLQEFISGQSADLAQDRNFLDALGINNTDTGLTALPSSTKDLTGSTGTIDMASFELQDQVPLGAYYPPASGLSAYSEPTTESAQAMADIASPYTAFLKRDSIAWPQTVPSSTESDSARLPTTSEHLNPLITSKGQRRTHEYNHSSEGPGFATTITARQYQCQCHDHIARDLMLLNISASRTWPTVTIDSILKCQQILQQLTDTILECAICCKTRVNLLMIVVVSIDSLVTALETITSVDSGVWDGVFVEYHESRLREYGQESLNGAANRRYKNGNFHFKAQVEECPLLVGGFPVPSEEKFTFVKQVLHARLCGLSSIIGRIQRCTEEILALPSSWGRLSMITETNRRVQLVMTKMKLPARR